MSAPAADRGHEVRRRLLAAAVELIPERGWAAVSTRILAQRAGVTPSVVHYHFRSMPELLNEAVIGAMRQLLVDLELFANPAVSMPDALEATLAAVDQFTGVDPVSLLFVEAYLAATRDDSLRAAMAEVITELHLRLAQQLHDQGVPEPEATATVVMATVDGLLLHRALIPAAGPVGSVVRRLVTDLRTRHGEQQ